MFEIKDILKKISQQDTSIAKWLHDQLNGDSDEIAIQLTRLQNLFTKFHQQYPKQKNVFIIRAPGRVNLIGEHTDYNGYPVLPIAIDREIFVTVAPLNMPVVRISNTDSKFKNREFNLSGQIQPGPAGDWENYVKAGVVGVLNEYNGFPSEAKGMAVVFSGNIPPAAGLSSSSAMVVVSAFALLAANYIEVDRLALAEILARAERFVGTEGGGMDQAISLLGQTGAALKIDFFPLQVKAAILPKGFSLIVAHSLVHAPKTESARLQYNRRPIECRLSTALLVREIRNRTGKYFPAQRLVDLSSENIGISQNDLDVWAQAAMTPEALSLKDITTKLGQPREEVLNQYCKMQDGSIFPEPDDGFKVRQRYRHVVSEAQRVNDAVAALEGSDMIRFGELMNASHASCRNDYEISCPELDALVEIARNNEALGARLTGAGFGGCAICLVREEDTESFIERLQKEYYEGYLEKYRPELLRTVVDLQEAVFSCRASQGAGVLFEKISEPANYMKN